MHLQMKNIVKHFDATVALDGVDLEVLPSEIHGLLGENGAGKSTLMNILAGIYQPTSGEIYLDGAKQEALTAKKSQQMGIRFIHQELNLVNDLNVYENIFLGEEIRNRFGLLDKEAMRKRTREILERMQIDVSPDDMVSDLDTSHKQLIEIAKALIFQAKLIIMDEPTTALTYKEIENLFVIMRSLKEDGVSIIYISHKMPELFAICDRYTVLRDGKYIDSGFFKDIDEKKATELLVGRTVSEEDLLDLNHSDEVILEVQDLALSPFYQGIQFTLKKGEVLGITGLQGDGRGELAETLFGMRRPQSGSITFKGKKGDFTSVKEAIRLGVGMVPRNRKERSIIPDMNILDNLSMAYFTKSHKGLISKKGEEQRFEENKKISNIKVGNPYDNINSLSGGNQQKVIISRWLETDSEVYLLDNPTQGIDVGAKFEIYSLIKKLAEQNKAIILFSAEFPEIRKVCHRCLVLYKGEVQAELQRDSFTESNFMYYATGGGKKNEQSN